MIWFYERDDDAVWIETTFDDETREYMISVSTVGGPARLERFQDLQEFDRRLAMLHQQFAANQWKQVPRAATAVPWRGAL